MSNADVSLALWVIAVVFTLMAVAVAVLFDRTKRLQDEINRLRSEAASRKSSIAQARAIRKPPGVDAHAVTTRRDTNDLPLTGRMSQGVKRVRTNARIDTDDRLPEHPGHPPA